MEIVKKTIKRATKKSSAGTLIMPDYDAIYYLNINLNAEVHDWGFFDAYVEQEEVAVDSEYDYVEPVIEEPLIPPDDEGELQIAPLGVTTGTWTATYSNLDVNILPADNTGDVSYNTFSEEIQN